MKRFVILICISFFIFNACQATPSLAPMPTPSPTSTPPPAEPVVLTLGAWRTSTERLNSILKVFNDAHPGISVRFAPTLSGDYDAVLQTQLGNGTAPDMFYLRSFGASQALFEQGHLVSLNALPGRQENFAARMLAPWRSGEVRYGVPYTASSHGIYYNQDIFAALGLHVLETWEQVLQTAQILAAAGYIPFANTSKDDWALAELMFMNLAPNFIGGYVGRQAYLNGARCFDDDHIVATFQAIHDMAAFMPPNHSLLGYVDSLHLFVQGKAAMWMSGSWDIPYFEESITDMNWNVFAIPAPALLTLRFTWMSLSG